MIKFAPGGPKAAGCFMSAEIKREFYLYNTLTRRREKLETVTPGRVGLYVCGPTVYGDPHLGHARPGITFDVLVRLLANLGYKVRYVRNITDVGHLEHDADEGEDKIAKKARLEELEPMEVAQTYTVHFRQAMAKLNVLPPSIEPNASGHIIEQIEFIKKILDNGYAYISNGSVYFDVAKYAKKYNYGALSGRNLDEMLHNTRELDGQQDKHSSADFALWKKASPEHIMRWPSPWGDGFPGWHMECSAMGEKYLGREFDIHGGGMDLMFPHHECEMAQNYAERGTSGVKYWMHNNLITIEGRKIGKSLGNFITLDELFSGSNPILEQAYTPMTVRFFILQAHYRGTLDFSNSALQAAEKGLKRLMQAQKDAAQLKESAASSENLAEDISRIREEIFNALCDDMNTPIALSYVYELVKVINNVKEGRITAAKAEKDAICQLMKEVVTDILGLVDEESVQASDSQGSSKVIDGLMNYIIEDRKAARANKDWGKSDQIRDTLKALGIQLKDNKDGTTSWEIQ